MENRIDELTEVVNKSVRINFVEENLVIDVRFVNETSGIKMIVDSGAPYSITSTKFMNIHMEEGWVYIECEECLERFTFGEDV